ncbi:hypothetical protein DFH06DRAFT_1324054 [Mycena polygramma]|nr:hypothetical protein DFH06DRAFT_1324054 [Mycena polygramma]
MTLFDDASSVLPPYTPSSVVPSYSAEPGHDERLIQHSPRTKPRGFVGKYIQKCGRDTVVLTGQDENAGEQSNAPTYGRRGVITGLVSLEDREMVSEVLLKVKGTIENMVSTCSAKKTVLDEQHTLWFADHPGVQCPSDLPFSTILPAGFMHNNSIYPLPPSYFVSYATPGGLYAKVFYTLSITVVRTRRGRFRLGPSKNTATVHFNYCPRTCPARPIPPSASDFLADVKVMPEEWHQMTLAVNPRPKVRLSQVDLNVFTPASDVFPLGEAIPVHVQLSGTVASLREFLPDAAGKQRSLIEVTLVRQMRLHLGERVEPTRITAARAVLLPSPPTAASVWDGSTASLDWVGELRCSTDITVGSFEAGILQVQDFIVVDVLEPAGLKARFARARNARPIRLVTDPWPV